MRRLNLLPCLQQQFTAFLWAESSDINNNGDRRWISRRSKEVNVDTIWDHTNSLRWKALLDNLLADMIGECTNPIECPWIAALPRRKLCYVTIRSTCHRDANGFDPFRIGHPSQGNGFCIKFADMQNLSPAKVQLQS